MNAILSQAKAEFYVNLTASARITRQQYDIAFNDSIIEFMNQQLGDARNEDPTNVQWNQKIRENLYTLITLNAPAVSAGVTITGRYFTVGTWTFNYPADYRNLLYIQVTVSGVTSYARPTTYNELGPLIDDSFKHPTNQKTFFLETSTGYTIYKGAATAPTIVMFYLKVPATFTIGKTSQIINAAGVLTNALAYYSLEQSVYNGVTFEMGDTITGTGAALTSGSVILASNTTPIALPDEVHDTICKMASEKILKSISEYEASVATQSEVDKDQ